MSIFIKPVRRIHTVFIHCSASDADGPNYRGSGLLKTFDGWHRARGFNGVGYHFLIDKDSEYIDPRTGLMSQYESRVILARSTEKTPAAQKDYNNGSIAICVHGLDINKFTKGQKANLINLCREINKEYNGSLMFRGHCEVDKLGKTCPVFNYTKWLGLDKFKHMKI